MKKILLLILCLCLVGCSKDNSNNIIKDFVKSSEKTKFEKSLSVPEATEMQTKIATEQISGNSTSLISYSYNEDGNLLSVQSSLGNSVLTYDTNNKNMSATETMQDGYKLYRSFDSNGNVTNVVLKDSQDNEVYSIGYSYASSNLMSLSASGRTITYTYNSFFQNASA